MDDDIIVFISDDDTYADEYKKLFKNVVIFKRDDYVFYFDEMHNERMNVCLHARIAIQDYCRKNGIDGYIMLDDDYVNVTFTAVTKNIKSLKNVCWRILKIMAEMPEGVKMLAFAQGGDFMAGSKYVTNYRVGRRRKAMNWFFCLSKRIIEWRGAINEDVNTYVYYGFRGGLYFTLWSIRFNQLQTQKTSGGQTELYKSRGTYLKSFFTVLLWPSGVYISQIGFRFVRIHHKVDWLKTVPMILKQKF